MVTIYLFNDPNKNQDALNLLAKSLEPCGDAATIQFNPGEIQTVDGADGECQITLYFGDWYIVLPDEVVEMIYEAYTEGSCVEVTEYRRRMEEEMCYIDRLKDMAKDLQFIKEED